MSRSRSVRRLAAASLAASALFPSACGTSDAAAAADGWVPGPLDEFSARIFGWSLDASEQRSQQEEQARLDAEHREMEAFIAACMAEYGFDYIPNEQGGSRIFFHDDEDGPQWGTRHFAETYGFAISTDPWGWNDRDADFGHEEWFDPNQEQLEAMSEAEQAAWWEALWGPPQEPDEDGNWPEWDPMQAGCAGRAQADRWQDPVQDDEFGWLADEMNRVWEAADADPRMTRLQSDWASCMADAGHGEFPDQNTMHNALWEEWQVVQGQDPSIWEGWDWEAFPDGPTFPEPDPAEVEAFTAREIAVAVADFDCRDELNFDAVQVEVHHDHQQQFVDRHGDALEQWASREEARRADA